jgi:opacity protein-like surface antigen
MRHSKMWRATMLVAAVTACLPTVAVAGGPGATVGIVRTSIGAGGWSASNGLDAGVSVGLGSVKGIRIQPEVRYVRRTAERTLDGGGSLLSGSLSVDYVEAPLLLRVRIGGPRRVTPTLCAGGFAALRTRARFAIQAGDVRSEADAKNDVRRWQSGLVVGAGVEVGRGNWKWVGELRYTRDFTSLDTASAGGEWTTSALRLLAGIRWK